jgi:hypothetical protein
MSCSACLFQKTLWTKVGGFDERIRTACDLDLLEAATAANDLAYVTETVAEWTARVETLYVSTGAIRRFEDVWMIIDRMGRRSLQSVLRRQWRLVSRQFLLEHAYEFRRSGLLRQSVRCLFRSVTRTG